MDWRWPLAALAAALSLMTAPAAFAAGSDPPASAGWHGREIRDPLPRPHERRRRAVPARMVGGRRGPRHRLRQPERLAARARGPAAPGAPRLPAGPVDGRFGPRTRAAVLWFQIKHGLAANRPRRRRRHHDVATAARRGAPAAPMRRSRPPPPSAPAATPTQDDLPWPLLPALGSCSGSVDRGGSRGAARAAPAGREAGPAAADRRPAATGAGSASWATSHSRAAAIASTTAPGDRGLVRGARLAPRPRRARRRAARSGRLADRPGLAYGARPDRRGPGRRASSSPAWGT